MPPVQPPPTSTLGFIRAPIVDKNGNASRDFVKWLQDLAAKTYLSLNILGELDPSIVVTGSAGTLGALLQNLTSSGQLDPLGVGFDQDDVNDGATFKRVINVDGGTNKTDTGSYVPNSISASVQSLVTVAVSVTAAFTLQSSITATTVGGSVLLFVSALLYNTTGVDHFFGVRIYKGNISTGTLIYDTAPLDFFVPNGTKGVPFCVAGLVDPSPGASQLYSLYAKTDSGAGIVGQMDNILLTAMNLKA